jgi:microcin C transport system ATP-binding protein
VDHVKAVQRCVDHLRAGQTLGVVGESGSGKTTLGLAHLAADPLEGPDRLFGRPLD